MSGVEGVIAELQRELAELRKEVAELRAENAQLRSLLDESRRGGKRQAAPFSKGAPKKNPNKPGRKPGSDYGRHVERPVPNRIDATIDVPALVFCPHCSGSTELTDVVDQYQIDLPPILPQVTQFRIHRSRCRRCKRIVMGRDPRQISDAVQVGRVHFGPRVIAFTAELNKVGGLSFGKISRFLNRAFGLDIERSSLVRMLGRLSRKAEPSYELLRDQIRSAAMVYPDETGWKIGGYPRWLWAMTDQERTVYSIERGRGYAEAAAILGEDYAGIIGSDGWASYQKFEHADRQTCLAHLLRRGRELRQSLSSDADLLWLEDLQSIFQHALSVRERRDCETMGSHGVAVARGLLEVRIDRLIDHADGLHHEIEKFARHLLRHRDELFLFLQWPGLEATNWPSEHAIRMAVINRKNSAGNRTERGARTQSVLMSVLRTCHQQSRDCVDIVSAIMTSPQPRAVEIAPSW